ncbi:RidA family protein, partial [Pseudomonas putida]|uniref:RidA family protein n=1 Tax=Pseudomonas putida TaxID=303 RepID=UPI003CFDDACF
GGMTADDRTQDIAGQTRDTLAKIEAYLEKAGSDKSRVLTAQIWIKDLARDFDSMNEVWNAWTAPGLRPHARHRPVRHGRAGCAGRDHRDRRGC